MPVEFVVEDFDPSQGDGDRPDCSSVETVIEGYDPATDPENLELDGPDMEASA